MTSSPDRAYTVVYDGDCRVCSRLVEVLATLDRESQLEIVPSQQPGVKERFPWIPSHAYADALQVIARDGTTWEAADAIEELIRALPRGKGVAWIFNLPFARALADRGYRWFARHRGRLGCGAHCQRP